MNYTYQVTDTFLDAVDLARLEKEIKDSAIVTALDYISGNDVEFTVKFKASLSGGDELILDQIVGDHTGEKLNFPSEVEVTNSLSVIETPPFAAPTFRTKRDATSSIIEVAAGGTETIDYILTEERYAQGGEIIYSGAQIGDYMSAEIYDVNSIIPEAYRAALCENWPSVAKYIIKHWINPEKPGQVIDTYPLNARITPGLALRIVYTAANSGNTRKVGINYFLSKKL